MKKLMFSALACVAFAFSGFASNEVVNEEKVLVEIVSKLKNQFTAEEIFDEDGERVCAKFSQEYTDFGGEKKTRSVTICSNHHTYEQIVKIVTDIYESGVNIFA